MALHQVHDQRILREEAYADDRQLDIRYRTHQLYTLEAVDFVEWTLDRLEWYGHEGVLDVGCGRGDWLRALARRGEDWRRLVGFDLSAGMVLKGLALSSGLPIHLLVGDAQALPFPDESFDVVMAGHMLYHVPDIGRAVADVARVLRPQGRFLTTTNSIDTMPEYRGLVEQAAARFPSVSGSETPEERFSLENSSAILQPCFARIAIHPLPGILRFPTAKPFVDYFASGRELLMRSDHADAEWHAVLDFVRTEVESVISRVGHFDVTKVSGAIVSVKGV